MLASRRKATGFPTGKTFFLEALRQQTVEAGMRVAWFRLGDLGVLIRSHRADDTVTRAVTRILRAELGVIDDIRLLPVATDAAEGLCLVVDAAYDNGPSRSAQPLSRRLRRAHAQNPRPAGPLTGCCTTPTLPDQRRFRQPHSGPRRKRSNPTELAKPNDGQPRRTNQWADLLAVTRQFYWPPAGTLTGRPWAEHNGH